MNKAVHTELWKGNFGGNILSLGRTQKCLGGNYCIVLKLHIIFKNTKGAMPNEVNLKIVYFTGF